VISIGARRSAGVAERDLLSIISLLFRYAISDENPTGGSDAHFCFGFDNRRFRRGAGSGADITVRLPRLPVRLPLGRSDAD